jgi:PAS domain S-box-containing protein
VNAVHPDDRQRAERAFLDANAKRARYEVDFRLRRRDGEYRWCIDSASPRFDPSGEYLGYVGSVLDITDRKRAQDALRDSEERLRLAVAIAQMGTFQVDLATDAAIVNDTGRLIYGWTADEPLTFERVQSHVHPADQKRVVETLAAALRPGGPDDFEIEHRIIRAGDGGERWLRVRGRKMLEGAGAGAARQAVRCVGTFIDITDQKAVEQDREQLLVAERVSRAQAEHASRMKDEFLATLSHELRTPAERDPGLGHDPARGRRDADDVAPGLDTIERNARAQTQIIEDLLDMSRIISGKVRLDVQRVDLAEVVALAIETVRPRRGQGHPLTRCSTPLAAPVSGDPNRLQQVLWNLLSNAIKFTPRGGRVQLCCRA